MNSKNNILHFEETHPILEIENFIEEGFAINLIDFLEKNNCEDECWGAVCFRKYWKKQYPNRQNEFPTYTEGVSESSIDDLNALIKKEAEIFLNGTPKEIEFSKLKGHRHGPHASTKKHGFAPGEVVCILVLNDNFTGGEIFIEDPAIEIIPKARSLYIFREGQYVEHGVRMVTSGLRLSIVSHWQKAGHFYSYAGANN